MTNNSTQGEAPTRLQPHLRDCGTDLYHRATRGLPEGAYVASWRNIYGEQLLFTQRPGARDGRLLHSDGLAMEVNDDRPFKVRGRAVADGLTIAVTNPPVILSEEERMWLTACWSASEWIRTTAVGDVVGSAEGSDS